LEKEKKVMAIRIDSSIRVKAAITLINNLQGYLSSEMGVLITGYASTDLYRLEVITDRIEKEVDEYMAKLHQCSK
jgi:hypothetical protein